MDYLTKRINSFELSDRLKKLERAGVEVPMLHYSINTPRHMETTEEGVEVYNHDGRILEVDAGAVIDSHGNVVNLRGLEAQFDPTEKKESAADRYQDTRMQTTSDTKDYF